MTKLFLDDLREPPDSTWVVVRSFEEFVSWIIKHGVPDIISFDHDLGDQVSTGLDCVKWLVETDRPIHDFLVHSANPPGRANIIGLLTNWQQECRRRELTDS